MPTLGELTVSVIPANFQIFGQKIIIFDQILVFLQKGTD